MEYDFIIEVWEDEQWTENALWLEEQAAWDDFKQCGVDWPKNLYRLVSVDEHGGRAVLAAMLQGELFRR